MLETLITSKTRIRILLNFFIKATNFGYLRSLAEEINEFTNTIIKKFNYLSGVAYLEKKASQNKVSYKANISYALIVLVEALVLNNFW